MSKTSPLSNSHELGLHGNHKNKDKADLLIIREIKNIKIYQISKYKNGDVDTKNISLNGYNFPTNAANFLKKLAKIRQNFIKI